MQCTHVIAVKVSLGRTIGGCAIFLKDEFTKNIRTVSVNFSEKSFCSLIILYPYERHESPCMRNIEDPYRAR